MKVFGDLEIVVRQVKYTIHFNYPHLKSYQKKVLNLINIFFVFNIIAIPKFENKEANSLAIISSRLSPLEYYEASKFLVELLYRTSVPNNVTNWNLFEDDSQII